MRPPYQRPYPFPDFDEIYQWAKRQPLSKILGDMQHEKTCVLAIMLNEIRGRYKHSLRNGVISVFDRQGFFHFSFIVPAWLDFLNVPGKDMTVGQFLEKLTSPDNII
jgi:hypothetical protein